MPEKFLQMAYQLRQGPRIVAGRDMTKPRNSPAYSELMQLFDSGFFTYRVKVYDVFEVMIGWPHMTIRGCLNKAVRNGLLRREKVRNHYEYWRAQW